MNIGAGLPPDEPSTSFFIGHHETSRSDAVTDDLLRQAEDLGYDFVTTPITTTAFQIKVVNLVSNERQRSHHALDLPLPLIPPLMPEDTILTPEASNPSRIAFASSWIDLGSPDLFIAQISRQVFNLEVGYAAFCGINNIVVYGPVEGSDHVQYGRAIREALGLGPYLQIHILLPMTGDLEMDYPPGSHLSEYTETSLLDGPDDEESESNIYDSWTVWDTIRSLCSYSQKLSIALELPRQLPSLALQSRWYSEPIRMLVFPRTSFLRNAKGYPVLSKLQQQLLSRFARLRLPPWMVLADVGSLTRPNSNGSLMASSYPTPAETSLQTNDRPKDPVSHLHYLRHLQQNQPARPPIERFGQGYQDFMQSPLQPLTDNLESITYEVFEKDPVKYEWYERAIYAALKDLRPKIDEQRPITIAVVGSGRGPLVTRALKASQSTGIEIKCWAVEKNPNAIVLLHQRNTYDPLWNGGVTIVKSDMRHWKGPVLHDEVCKVDIFVSELLGSFADNELSPECLDGVQHILHPDHGISIPQSYTAHLTPLSTPRLHADLLGRSGNDKWDIPYVVMLHQYDYLSLQLGKQDDPVPNVQKAWSFAHPVSSRALTESGLRAGGGFAAGGWVGGDGHNEHNARSCKTTFQVQGPGVCHGIAGYFEAVLYSGPSGTIELSTNPVTMDAKSQDMISWFPIFFPIKSPLHVPQGAEMVVYMWRQTDDRSVWYEWLIEVLSISTGRRRRIATSEMGSSRKNGCLM